jgi:hypothetical protein
MLRTRLISLIAPPSITPNAGAVRGRQGGELRPHHLHITALALLFLVTSFAV